MLVLSITAIAPHQHEGLVERVFGDAIESVAHCAPTAPQHFDAARTVHSHPCVACVRDHSAGTFRTAVIGFTASLRAERVPIVVALPLAQHRDFTPLRGPPAA